MKLGIRAGGSSRNDPSAERNLMSSVQRAGRRHVSELGHSVGHTPPYLLAIVIILCRKFICTRAAFLERFVTIIPEHEASSTLDVDLGYHAGNTDRKLPRHRIIDHLLIVKALRSADIDIDQQNEVGQQRYGRK